MQKFALFFGMLLMGSPAMAGGLVNRITSSVQLNVDAHATQAVRVGNSYSVSGSGVKLDVDGGSAAAADLNVGGLGTLTSGVAAGDFSTAYQTTAGENFQFTQSFTAGDASITSAPTVGEVSPFSNQTSTAGGTVGDLAGTLGRDGAIDLTAGGAGTSAIGQFVTEITILD